MNNRFYKSLNVFVTEENDGHLNPVFVIFLLPTLISFDTAWRSEHTDTKTEIVCNPQLLFFYFRVMSSWQISCDQSMKRRGSKNSYLILPLRLFLNKQPIDLNTTKTDKTDFLTNSYYKNLLCGLRSRSNISH